MGLKDKKRSQRQERDVAKTLGGNTVVASGAKWFADSDVRSDKFLVECKTTKHHYFNVTQALWEKILLEANRDHGRIPLMVIDLNHDSVRSEHRYVVFDVKSFDSLPQPYENSGKQIQKSYRIESTFLEECSAEMGQKVWGKLFCIMTSDEIKFRKVRHMLFYMEIEDFLKYYEAELKED